jgi:probable F420-dependent oxidoreductase
MDLKRPIEGIGKVGVFSWETVMRPAFEVRAGVRAIEGLGYSAVWFPESRGREAFTAASLILEATERIVVATGIASIWARDPMAAAFGAFGLADAHPGRFILGLGVSHAPSVERRGHAYHRPLRRMEEYLDTIEATSSPIAGAEATVPVILAALGPKMLALAAGRTAGAHPYFVPVEHTRAARDVVGPGPYLAPEQAVVLDADPERARSIARRHTRAYLGLDNYRNNLVRMGWSETDLADGGSDRLVDAVVAWGDAGDIARRIQEHFDAGADHVCIQVLSEHDGFPLRELEALAAHVL